MPTNDRTEAVALGKFRWTSSSLISLIGMGSQMARIEGDRVKTFSAADNLNVVNIQALYEHAGRLWIGGERGLALLTDNRFQSLTPDGKEVFTGVSGIVQSANGDLWLNATPGILHIPAVEIERAIKEPAYRVHCERFDALDGLTGQAVQLRPLPTLVESSDGRLWFSTLSGIVQIDPNHLLRNPTPPSVFIRSLDSASRSSLAYRAGQIACSWGRLPMGRYCGPNASDYSHCLLLAGMGEMTVLLMAATAMVLALLFFGLSPGPARGPEYRLERCSIRILSGSPSQPGTCGH